MEELKADNLDQLLRTRQKVVVQFGASWCGMCRVIRPKVDQLSQETPEIEFLYVDAENFPESRQFAKVDNLPTFAGFVNGKLVKQASGTKIELVQGVVDEVARN